MKYNEKFNRYETTTPKVMLHAYAWLTKPDTKFNPKGVYKADATIEAGKYADELFEVINKVANEAHAEAMQKFKENPPKPVKGKPPAAPTINDLPMWVEKYDDEGNPLEYVIRVSSNATRTKDGKDFQVELPLYDSKGKRIKLDSPLGADSIVKFKLGIGSYTTAGKSGTKLFLDAVMVVDNVPVQAGGAFGSDDFEEDGYTGETYNAPSNEQAQQSEGDPEDF